LTGTLPHLVRRFIGTITAKPLTAPEQDRVAALLAPGEAALFWAQAPADRRHAYDTMARTEAVSDDSTVLAAALLHDVGKVAGSRNALARSLATVLDALGWPMPAAMRRYRDHGQIGAELLEATGASTLAVDFARRHPSADPRGVDPRLWAVLLAADDE
jgi:hypothetical protein